MSFSDKMLPFLIAPFSEVDGFFFNRAFKLEEEARLVHWLSFLKFISSGVDLTPSGYAG